MTTDLSDEHLLPCPFCGCTDAAAVLVSCPGCNGTGDQGGNPLYGACDDCGGIGIMPAPVKSPAETEHVGTVALSRTDGPDHPRIWLQPFAGDEGGHTWCSERIEDEDIEYVRLSDHEAALAGAREQIARLTAERGEAQAKVLKLEARLGEIDTYPINPDFEAWKAGLPQSHWARYDLSACRLGWEAHAALEGGGSS